jgi:hypothetical protein
MGVKIHFIDAVPPTAKQAHVGRHVGYFVYPSVQHAGFIAGARAAYIAVVGAVVGGVSSTTQPIVGGIVKVKLGTPNHPAIRTPLLHNMSQFMGEQMQTAIATRVVTTLCKCDIAAQCKRARIDRR